MIKVQKKYDALYGDVKRFFEESTSGKLNSLTVITLVRYTMEAVQTGKMWENMRGSEKKDLVLGVLGALVEDLINDPDVVGENFSEQTKESILSALAMAPMMIDAAVDFAKVYGGGSNSGSNSQKRCCSFC